MLCKLNFESETEVLRNMLVFLQFANIDCSGF